MGTTSNEWHGKRGVDRHLAGAKYVEPAAQRRSTSCWRSGDLLLLSLLLTACGEPGDELAPEAELGEIQQAVIDGTVTTARPEVGVLTSSFNSACSAVLIGPSWILTAAHCVDVFRSTQSASFQIPGRQWANGRAAVFKTDFFLPFAGQTIVDDPVWGTTDIAVGHLTETVPPEFARPVKMDDIWGKGTGNFTVLGYGCTAHGGPPGGYTKTYAENDDGRLCKGDSGGGLFRGRLNDNGALIGINSQIEEDIFSYYDHFGNVPRFKERIAAIMRSVDLGLEAGMERVGNTYRTIALSGYSGLEAWVCGTECQKDAACKAFTYKVVSNTCELKDTVGSMVPMDTAWSGLPPLVGAFDRRGSDYTSMVVENSDQCVGACARDAQCKSFVFNTGNKKCFLKNAIPEPIPCTNCLSGVRRSYDRGIARKPMEHPGNNWVTFNPDTIEIKQLPTADACAKECVSRGCLGFNFYFWGMVPNQTGGQGPNVPDSRCSIWTGHMPPPTRNVSNGSAIVSAPRRNYDYNVRRPGGRQVAGQYPSNCQAACSADSKCQAWTHFPQTSNAAARCMLLDTITQAESAPLSGIASGLKGLDFF